MFSHEIVVVWCECLRRFVFFRREAKAARQWTRCSKGRSRRFEISSIRTWKLSPKPLVISYLRPSWWWWSTPRKILSMVNCLHTFTPLATRYVLELQPSCSTWYETNVWYIEYPLRTHFLSLLWLWTIFTLIIAFFSCRCQGVTSHDIRCTKGIDIRLMLDRYPWYPAVGFDRNMHVFSDFSSLYYSLTSPLVSDYPIISSRYF